MKYGLHAQSYNLCTAQRIKRYVGLLSEDELAAVYQRFWKGVYTVLSVLVSFDQTHLSPVSIEIECFSWGLGPHGMKRREEMGRF